MKYSLSPPQRPLSCCFDRKGFLAVGLNPIPNIILKNFHSLCGGESEVLIKQYLRSILDISATR